MRRWASIFSFSRRLSRLLPCLAAAVLLTAPTAFGRLLQHGETENPYTGDSDSGVFQSKYQDSESGLVYFGYRYYSPTLGIFISRDPLQEEGGVNLYGYGKGCPLAIDELGLATLEETLTSGNGEIKNFAVLGDLDLTDFEVAMLLAFFPDKATTPELVKANQIDTGLTPWSDLHAEFPGKSDLEILQLRANKINRATTKMLAWRLWGRKGSKQMLQVYMPMLDVTAMAGTIPFLGGDVAAIGKMTTRVAVGAEQSVTVAAPRSTALVRYNSGDALRQMDNYAISMYNEDIARTILGAERAMLGAPPRSATDAGGAWLLTPASQVMAGQTRADLAISSGLAKTVVEAQRSGGAIYATVVPLRSIAGSRMASALDSGANIHFLEGVGTTGVRGPDFTILNVGLREVYAPYQSMPRGALILRFDPKTGWSVVKGFSYAMQ